MRYALGIDGGGSKCDAALVDETGSVVGWGRGGPIHAYYHPPEVIAASYRDAVTRALGDTHADELWVAGALRAGDLHDVLAAPGRRLHHLKADEIDTAFAAAQEDCGLVVLSGTGSFLHGRSPNGRNLHWGGTGPVLNDYGSGHDIGLRGLRAAFASGWTESRRTSLADAIPRALGVDDLRAVFHLVYVHNMKRPEIAALARAVNDQAEAGDPVARDCIHRAADDLSALAVDMIHELELAQSDFPIIAIGSVAQRCRIWWARVCDHIVAAAPRARPLIPRLRPAVGAALLALRHIGVACTPELIRRLIETQDALAPPT